jgi:hypothetical protein
MRLTSKHIVSALGFLRRICGLAWVSMAFRPSPARRAAAVNKLVGISNAATAKWSASVTTDVVAHSWHISLSQQDHHLGPLSRSKSSPIKRFPELQRRRR